MLRRMSLLNGSRTSSPNFSFRKILAVSEAVPQLLLTPKILLLFGFNALFAFLFLPILNCWTASS